MNLGELKIFLDHRSPKTVVKIGFDCPHSYRGHYNEVAFEPTRNITVKTMRQAVHDAINGTFDGWKGGSYKMNEFTPCWLANRGSLGELIGPVLLAYMFDETDDLDPEAL